MKNAYLQKYVSSRGYFVKSFLALSYILLLSFGNSAYGQVSALYSFSQSNGTYTPITGGTVLATATAAAYASSADNVVWNLADGQIPFTFTFNGTGYTGLNVSSNGFITFGATAPGTAEYTPISSTTAYAGAVAAWGGDLNAAFVSGVIAGEVRWEVVGSAPNRELVVQYKDWRPSPTTSTTTVPYLNFQIRLAEGSNAVRIVYGATGSAAGTPTTANTRQIGLRGAANTDFNNRTNSTTTAFTASTPGSSNTATQAFSYASGSTQGLPTNGLTYTWTLATCISPTAVTPSAVTTTGATVTWTAASVAPANGYEYEVRTSGAAGSGATGLFTSGSTAAGVVTTNITAMNPATTYSVYVRSNCGSSDFSSWTPAASFLTLCAVETAPTAVQTFVNATGTSPDVCWSEATGTLAATTTLTAGNSEWLASSGFANTGSNKGIKTNLYSAGNEWFISQAIDLGSTTPFRVKYDMAVTSYDGTTAQPTLGSHKVQLVISTDGGLTWSNANILKTYTGAATYSNTGVTEFVPLTGYTGIVKLAFVATTTSTSPDIDFHIDNFSVEAIPSCAEPLAVVALATTATTATISWTAPATAPTGGYEYEIRTSGAAGSGVTGLVTSGTTAAGVVTKNITGLTANTNYAVYIRSNCGSGSFSTWTDTTNLFTGYCTPAPSSVDGLGIIKVVAGTISNTSIAEVGNFGDYSTQSTDVEISSTVNVAITYSTGFTYDTKIWVDWNNDLDFSDAGENVYTGTSTSADPTTLAASFTVPVGAPLGSHRMRIGGQDSGPATPCYSGTYGSYEDYTINVICPATIPAPTAAVGDILCPGETADLSVTGVTNATLAWYDAATAGALVDSDNAYTTGALTTTTSYWVEQAFPGCPGTSTRLEVVATVVPVNVTLTPINNTCNGYAAGSFALGTVTCGVAPFTYSVNGGAFGPIPTNLAAGTYSVVVKDDAAGLSQPVSVVITQPATVIATPVTANTTACEGATTKVVTAQSIVLAPAAAPLVVSFDLAAQPAQVFAAPGSIISTATMPALPAGAVVTSVTLGMPGLVALAGTWEADIRLGVSGAVANNAASGVGATQGAGTFNYTRTLPNNSVNVAGGNVNLLYWNFFNDLAGATEATFPTGTGVATLTIQYSIPDPNGVSWWTATTGGSLLSSTASLETVGTSTLASPAAPGTYTFYAQTESGACSSVTRSPLVVTVNANPMPTITSPSLEFCAGGDLDLTASAATSYAWSTTETSNMITVDAPGSYTVTVTDANGCVGTSAPAVVTENALPAVNAGVDQTVCANATVTLSGAGATSYTWNNGVTNATAFTATATTTYTVTGTDANGCENTDQVVVNVNALPVPVITASGSLAICAGSDVDLTASGTTGNVWSTTETGNTITVDEAGSYTVTETDVNGCVGTSAPVVVTINALPSVNAGADIAVCQNGQAILFATGAQTYAWTGNITNGVSFVAAATTTYTVTGTDANGCVNTDAVTVTVNPLPTVEAGVNQTLCGAGQVTLTATGATVYYWNNGVVNGVAFNAPVGNNIYVVTGVDALGCSNTDVVSVNVNPVPVATATAANQLTIVASPAGMSYQWINCTTNNPILGANSQTFTATENGSYKVMVTGMGGCTATSACVNINSVGLDDLNADLGITLYPNPTAGNIYVNMPASEQANITVYDAQGKVVSVMDNAQNGAVIDLNNVETGMYMIHVANANGSNIFRIVKN